MLHGGKTPQTSFGFRSVDAQDRQNLVNDVFSRVAGPLRSNERPDVGRMHRLWKADLINWLAPSKREPMALLDSRAAHGDMARRFLDARARKSSAPFVDISAEC